MSKDWSLSQRALLFGRANFAHLTEDSDGSAERIVSLPRSARACFALFSDIDRSLEWVPWIGSCEIVRRDALERAIFVDYLVQFARGTVAYSLCYLHSDRELSVRFTTPLNSAISMSGTVVFTPAGADACMMHLVLKYDTGRFGAQMGETQNSHQKATAMIAEFRDFVQRELPTWPRGTNPDLSDVATKPNIRSYTAQQDWSETNPEHSQIATENSWEPDERTQPIDLAILEEHR